MEHHGCERSVQAARGSFVPLECLSMTISYAGTCADPLWKQFPLALDSEIQKILWQKVLRR